MTKITNTYVLDKAKMSVLLLIMLFTCPLAFAQSEPETAKPLTDMEVVRKVALILKGNIMKMLRCLSSQ